MGNNQPSSSRDAGDVEQNSPQLVERLTKIQKAMMENMGNPKDPSHSMSEERRDEINSLAENTIAAVERQIVEKEERYGFDEWRLGPAESEYEKWNQKGYSYRSLISGSQSENTAMHVIFTGFEQSGLEIVYVYKMFFVCLDCHLRSTYCTCAKTRKSRLEPASSRDAGDVEQNAPQFVERLTKIQKSRLEPASSRDAGDVEENTPQFVERLTKIKKTLMENMGKPTDSRHSMSEERRDEINSLAENMKSAVERQAQRQIISTYDTRKAVEDTKKAEKISKTHQKEAQRQASVSTYETRKAVEDMEKAEKIFQTHQKEVREGLEKIYKVIQYVDDAHNNPNDPSKQTAFVNLIKELEGNQSSTTNNFAHNLRGAVNQLSKAHSHVADEVKAMNRECETMTRRVKQFSREFDVIDEFSVVGLLAAMKKNGEKNTKLVNKFKEAPTFCETEHKETKEKKKKQGNKKEERYGFDEWRLGPAEREYEDWNREEGYGYRSLISGSQSENTAMPKIFNGFEQSDLDIMYVYKMFSVCLDSHLRSTYCTCAKTNNISMYNWNNCELHPRHHEQIMLNAKPEITSQSGQKGFNGFLRLTLPEGELLRKKNTEKSYSYDDLDLAVSTPLRKDYQQKTLFEARCKKDEIDESLFYKQFCKYFEEISYGEVAIADMERHGPSAAINGIDNVPAIWSRFWPLCTLKHRNILGRTPKSGTPSKELKFEMMMKGCLVVSKDNGLFRISFSEAETLLCRQWNPTQRQTFMTLKHLRQTAMQEKGIESYHLKTCMFWCIEIQPKALWVDENLLQAVTIVLDLLARFLKKGKLPHYFISSINLFAGKNDSDRVDSLERVTVRDKTAKDLCEIMKKLDDKIKIANDETSNNSADGNE